VLDFVVGEDLEDVELVFREFKLLFDELETPVDDLELLVLP